MLRKGVATHALNEFRENPRPEWFYPIPAKKGGGGAGIEGKLASIEVAGSESPYAGLTIGTVTVWGAPCDQSSLIDTEVEVVDHSGCVFDLTEEELGDVWVWAVEKVFKSLASGAEEGELTPCHWSADDRCCVDADSEA